MPIMATPAPRFVHSRQNSHASVASGASYQLILEHILAYPGTYEIPLRTMYTLNCAPRAQPMTASSSRAPSPASSKSASPTTPTFAPYDTHTATVQFTSALMDQISQLPAQPSSLPPRFVTSFVNRCFPVELELVDFPQSLAAMDYLKDLEMRRRKDIAQSFKALNLDQSNLSSEMMGNLRQWNPTIAEWIVSLEYKLKRVEALYTQLYISLRRWVLINEMCLEPFNKNNCLAMLNTLYPPVMSSQPTTRLTIPTLMSQRNGFFKYIQTVDKRGTGCLETLMKQGRKEGEANGWAAVRRNLTSYLVLTNSILDECWDVINLRFNMTRPLEPVAAPPTVPRPEEETEKRNGRKVDSGISFGTHGLHSKNSSTSSSASSAMAAPATPSEASFGKSGTALERLAREFRRMRPKKSLTDLKRSQSPYALVDQENAAPMPLSPPPPPPKHRGMNALRKMKSLGAIHDYKQQNASTSSFMGFTRNATPTFDSMEMRRQRDVILAREADAS